MIALTATKLPPAQLEGLQQRLQQARQIAEPPGSCSAFEVNLFWLLLEQDVRAVVDHLWQHHQLEPLETGWALAGVPSSAR